MQLILAQLHKPANKKLLRGMSTVKSKLINWETVPEGSSHKAKIQRYFNENCDLSLVKRDVPSKYFALSRRRRLRHFYLMNKVFAEDIVNRIMPYLKDQVICETNAGLGLITSELIRRGIKHVRVYETCAEFRSHLREMNYYPMNMEIHISDICYYQHLQYADQFDKHNRLSKLLEGIDPKDWNEDPAFTIIGPMPNTYFISSLIRSIVVRDDFVKHGRPQVFALLPFQEYRSLIASPEMNLWVYTKWAILFQLFFNYEVLHSYCAKSFLPWRTSPRKGPDEHILLVKILPKQKFPVDDEHLAHLYYFVLNGFKRGHQKVIPVMENWVPGIGAMLIVPPAEYKAQLKNKIDIFTEFGDLQPDQILQLFLIMLNHPHFSASPFIGMVESHLIKYASIDSFFVNEEEDDSDILDDKNESVYTLK